MVDVEQIVAPWKQQSSLKLPNKRACVANAVEHRTAQLQCSLPVLHEGSHLVGVDDHAVAGRRRAGRVRGLRPSQLGTVTKHQGTSPKPKTFEKPGDAGVQAPFWLSHSTLASGRSCQVIFLLVCFRAPMITTKPPSAACCPVRTACQTRLSYTQEGVLHCVWRLLHGEISGITGRSRSRTTHTAQERERPPSTTT